MRMRMISFHTDKLLIYWLICCNALFSDDAAMHYKHVYVII